LKSIFTSTLLYVLTSCCVLLIAQTPSAFAEPGKVETLIKSHRDLKEPFEVYRIQNGVNRIYHTELDRDQLGTNLNNIFVGTSFLTVAEVLTKGSLAFVNDRLEETEALRKVESPETQKHLEEAARKAKIELVKTFSRLPVFYGDVVKNREALYALTQSLSENSSKLFTSLGDPIIINTSVSKLDKLTEATDTTLSEMFKLYLHSILKLSEVTGRPVVLSIEEIDTFTQVELKRIQEFFSGPNYKGQVLLLGSSSDPKFNEAIELQDYSQALFKPLATSTPAQKVAKTETIESQLKKAGIHQPKAVLEAAASFGDKYDMRISDEILLTIAHSELIQSSIQLQRDHPNIPAGLEADEFLTYLEEAIIQAIESNEAKGQDPEEVEMIHVSQVLRARTSKNSDLPFDPSDLQARLKFKRDLIEKMNSRVFGQERMTEDIVSLYLRLISNPNKRIGTMAMLGPTGTGKTFSAEVLADLGYGNKEALFTINGNEFEGHNASSEMRKLFGTPPSYIGHDQTRGAFVEWIEDEKRGYNGGVIVINEADKASPTFWKYFMEFLDGKAIQKNGGGTKEQRAQKGASEPLLQANNHLVILTTNQGDRFLYPEEMKKLSEAEARAWVDNLSQAELKDTFSSGGNGGSQAKLHPSIPERIDIFSPAYLLSKESALKIIRAELSKISGDYLSSYGIDLELEDSVENYFIEVFYDKTKGARRIKSGVQSQVQKGLENALEKLEVSQNENVLVRTLKTNTGYSLEVEANGQKESRTIEGLSIPDAVKDPVTLERIQHFEERMKERLYGQRHAIHTVSQAARGKMAFLDKRARPLSIMIVGASGVGKTETFRAIAHSWYGSANRLRVISLEDVQSVEEVFGHYADSFQADQPMRLLEKALSDNKDGGVILFDEIDKVGGGNPAIIRQFMLKMHSILEEGVWISPSGTEYPMGKYILGFTGNFLSNLFDGISRYEAQKNIWEDNRSRDHLSKLLVDTYKLQGGASVIPDSFLKRQDVVLLAEPLAPDDTLKITKKHIENELGFFEKELGTKLVITDEFINELTLAYYSLGSGAGRAVRSILRSHIKSYINMVRADLHQRFVNGETELNVDELEVELRINDNLPLKAYITDISWERKVEVELISKISGQTIDQRKYDVSKTVPDKRRRPAKLALKTAYHEAGHAVANIAEKTLLELKLITIFSEDNYLGVNIFDHIKNTEGTNLNWETAKYSIAMSLAGERAQILAGFPEDTGQSGDQANVDRLIRMILIKGKFHPDVKGMQFDESGRFLYPTPEKIAKFEAVVKKLYEEAEALADQLLVENWNLVRDVTSLLMKQGDISGNEYSEMKSEHDEELAKATLQKWIINNDGHVVRLENDNFIGRFLAKRHKQASRLRDLDPKMNHQPVPLKGSCEDELVK